MGKQTAQEKKVHQRYTCITTIAVLFSSGLTWLERLSTWWMQLKIQPLKKYKVKYLRICFKVYRAFHRCLFSRGLKWFIINLLQIELSGFWTWDNRCTAVPVLFRILYSVLLYSVPHRIGPSYILTAIHLLAWTEVILIFIPVDNHRVLTTAKCMRNYKLYLLKH